MAGNSGRVAADELTDDGLTFTQVRFCEEFAVDLNATQAAIRAGYSEASAASIGKENLQKPHINARIRAETQKLSDRTHISQDWVIRALINNHNRAMQLEAVRDKSGNPTGEYRYDGAVANRAIELLGKHLQMFPEKSKLEVSGPNGGPIELRRAADMTDDELAQIATRTPPAALAPHNPVDSELYLPQNNLTVAKSLGVSTEKRTIKK